MPWHGSQLHFHLTASGRLAYPVHCTLTGRARMRAEPSRTQGYRAASPAVELPTYPHPLSCGSLATLATLATLISPCSPPLINPAGRSFVYLVFSLCTELVLITGPNFSR